ncbi:MAG: ABC transporter ATP-binding protein/permease [Clostridiales bacterium]|jgi:ABC-type lipoprotein export system ATPase subunit|nr:ABC transporter ATP-binding protein/permease [Clostridiales bacterium]
MIEVANLTKIYSGKHTVPTTALKDVSFSLPSSGMVFLLGKSGCGKTTLLNCLGTMDSFESGSVTVDGKNIAQMTNTEKDHYRARHIGVVFQEFYLLDNKTVGENISLGGDVLKKRFSAGEIDAVLREVGLEGYAGKKCNMLSGGERQRVSIARALIKGSKLILADEPTGMLDSENGQKLFGVLKNIAKTRLVVIASHDQESANRYADVIIRLKDGQIESNDSINQATNANEPAYASDSAEKTVKTGLTVRKQFKMAVGNLLKAPFKFILSLVLIVVASAMFFISSVFMNVDGPTRLVNAMQEQGERHAVLAKESMQGYGSVQEKLSQNEIARIKADNGGIDFHIIWGGDCGVAIPGLPGVIDSVRLEESALIAGKLPTSKIGEYVITRKKAVELLAVMQSATPYPGDGDKTGSESSEYAQIDDLIGYDGVWLYTAADMYRPKLCGIIEDHSVSDEFIYFKSGTLADLSEGDVLCKGLLFSLSVHEKDNIRLFKMYYGDVRKLKDGETGLFIETPFTMQFYDFMATYFSLIGIFAGISAALFVLVVLLCYFIISESIKRNQKENGILRSLGLSNVSIMKMYFLQNILLNVAALPFTIIFGFVLIGRINDILISSVGALFKLFSVSPVNILITALILLAVSIVSTVFPLIKVFKGKPIDIIRREA